MKKILCLAAGLLALNFTPVFGQPASPPFAERLANIQARADQEKAANAPALTKFNLDFPGGTPAELVKAIEKATGKPLNVIIPDEYARTGIPALKMGNVDVPQLFNAVVNTSYRYGPDRPGYAREVISSYGFETKDSPVSDNSIWYFFVYQATPPKPPGKIVQFYNLDTFLNRGFTVDDITTAIQTGWKMAGVNPPPELNYHKETKLLIAYGEPVQLQTINSVLNSLPSSNAPRNEIDSMKTQINALTIQLGDLKKKVNAAPGGAEEKTGK